MPNRPPRDRGNIGTLPMPTIPPRVNPTSPLILDRPAMQPPAAPQIPAPAVKPPLSLDDRLYWQYWLNGKPLETEAVLRNSQGQIVGLKDGFAIPDWRTMLAPVDQNLFLSAVAQACYISTPEAFSTFAATVNAQHHGRIVEGGTASDNTPGGVYLVYPSVIVVGIRGATTNAQWNDLTTKLDLVRVDDDGDIITPGDGDLTGRGKWIRCVVPYGKDWMAHIAELRTSYPGREVVVCGHSLGGAICEYLVAMDLQVSNAGATLRPGHIVKGCAWGTPKTYVRHGTFSRAFGPHMAVFNYVHDPVARLPYTQHDRAPSWYTAYLPTITRAMHFGHERPVEDWLGYEIADFDEGVQSIPESLGEFKNLAASYHTMDWYWEYAQAGIQRRGNGEPGWDSLKTAFVGVVMIPAAQFA